MPYLSRFRPTTGSRRRDGAWAAFEAAHSAEAGWILANVERNGFAYSLRSGVERFGSLTERQLDAVRRNLSPSFAAANPGPHGLAFPPPPTAPTAPPRIEIDGSRIKAALETARTNGLRRAKLRYQRGLAFALAADNSRNPGAVYVTVGSIYAGSIKDGTFRKANGFDVAIAPFVDGIDIFAGEADFFAMVRHVADNPHGAAVTVGHLTGSCCCCGRTLTDPESVARGIGPICEGRFGWAERLARTTVERVRVMPASEREEARRWFDINSRAAVAAVADAVARHPAPVNDCDGMEQEDL